MRSKEIEALKTELVTWERSFSAEHGRKPTKDDISGHGLKERYRTYAKLKDQRHKQVLAHYGFAARMYAVEIPAIIHVFMSACVPVMYAHVVDASIVLLLK